MFVGKLVSLARSCQTISHNRIIGMLPSSYSAFLVVIEVTVAATGAATRCHVFDVPVGEQHILAVAAVVAAL